MKTIARELCIYILENLNDDISMDKIENDFHYSKYYLIHIFKLFTGYTIKEFINTVKVLKTINPIIFTDDTILKIALCNGFNSQEYFSEKFKEVIGISPLRFRKEFKNIDEMDNICELELRKEYLMYLKKYEQQLLNLPNSLEVGSVKKLERTFI